MSTVDSHFANAVIVGVGDVKRAVGVEGYAEWRAQSGVAGLPAVTLSAGLSGTRESCDYAVRCDLSNAYD